MVICGIYKITSPSGKIYIGQSQDIEERWKSYKWNVHNQRRLKYSFNKYGVENHTFEIIEECLFEELNCRERHWQDFYDVLGKNGMNAVLQGCEDKAKVTSRNKEVYDTFYKITYSGVNEVMRVTGDKTIKNKLNGQNFNDTRFVYKEDFNNDVFKENKIPLIKYNSVIDKVTFVVFDSVTIAAEIYNIPKATLKEYLDGVYENKTNLEYLYPNKNFREIKSGKKVIDKVTGVIYKSVSEASRMTGVNRCSLKGYLNGIFPNKTTLEYYNE